MNSSSDEPYGWKKKSNNFTFVTIKNSGHIMPSD